MHEDGWDDSVIIFKRFRFQNKKEVLFKNKDEKWSFSCLMILGKGCLSPLAVKEIWEDQHQHEVTLGTLCAPLCWQQQFVSQTEKFLFQAVHFSHSLTGI